MFRLLIELNLLRRLFCSDTRQLTAPALSRNEKVGARPLAASINTLPQRWADVKGDTNDRCWPQAAENYVRSYVGYEGVKRTLFAQSKFFGS
jgi:hypothetical protein